MDKITLVVGDWSDDGHGKIENVYIESNLSAEEIYKAYKDGCKIVRFDLSEDIARGYEECEMSVDVFNKLTEHKIERFEAEGRYTNVQDFAYIYLQIAEIGNEKFKWEYSLLNNYLDIGGYGLLYG